MDNSAVNFWANFLANEKLVPAQLNSKDIENLMSLCSRCAETRTPFEGKGVSHIQKINARQFLVNTAMDMGIDLMAIKKSGLHGGKKLAMGRGLLDIWNEEYKRRYGSTVGTFGEAEIIRRKIVTKLAKERKSEDGS